jgi:hypothetical protein
MRTSVRDVAEFLLARFRRALATGNPLLVGAAAAELNSVSLADAFSICLVFLRAEPSRS